MAQGHMAGLMQGLATPVPLLRAPQGVQERSVNGSVLAPRWEFGAQGKQHSVAA